MNSMRVMVAACLAAAALLIGIGAPVRSVIAGLAIGGAIVWSTNYWTRHRA